MRKPWVMLTAVSMTVGLAACGNSEDIPPETESNHIEEVSPSTDSQEVTENQRQQHGFPTIIFGWRSLVCTIFCRFK